MKDQKKGKEDAIDGIEGRQEIGPAFDVDDLFEEPNPTFKPFL